MSRIGSWSLHTIETGRFGLDGGAMFGIVPKPLWQKRIAADELNRIPLNARCLLLTDGDRCILVDNGIGNKQDEKFLKIYGVDTTTMELDASLSAVGFHRSDVTDVILTHLHFDHCGGYGTGERHIARCLSKCAVSCAATSLGLGPERKYP